MTNQKFKKAIQINPFTRVDRKKFSIPTFCGFLKVILGRGGYSYQIKTGSGYMKREDALESAQKEKDLILESNVYSGERSG